MSVIDPLLDHAPLLFLSFADDGRIAGANATLVERLRYPREELDGKHVESVLTVAGRVFYQTHVFPIVKMHGSADEIFLIVEGKYGEQLGTLWNMRRRVRDGRAVTDCFIMEVRERRKYEDALLAARRAAEAANALLEEQSATLTEQAVELEVQHQQLSEQAGELEAQADALRMANDDLMAHGEELERQRAVALEAQQVADAANRAKSEFLATMSHELRTPLNAIGGYTELLTTGIYGTLNDEQLHALSRVARSQRHLLGLINDILNLARIESGRVDYRLTRVALDEVVRELREMIDPQVRAGGLTFEVQVDAGLTLRVDHEKTVQVLLNLLSNAVKFTAPGGHVGLKSSAAPNKDGLVTIEVADTGRGIPANRLEAVFEPFVQVRADATPGVNEGTGLGLAISRNLARGMGGDLTATSEVGKGSVFCLTLPSQTPMSS